MRTIDYKEFINLLHQGEFILRDAQNGKDWLYDEDVYIVRGDDRDSICLEDLESITINDDGSVTIIAEGGFKYIFNVLELKKVVLK